MAVPEPGLVPGDVLEPGGLFLRCVVLGKDLHEYNKRVRPGWLHVVIEQCSDALVLVGSTCGREPGESPSKN